MNSWYDITGISKVSELRADQQGMQASIDHILSIIQTEIDAGVPRCRMLLAGVCASDALTCPTARSERIMIGGFSQGGCVALASAFSCPHPLAGVIALSTVFPRGIADKPAPGASALCRSRGAGSVAAEIVEEVKRTAVALWPALPFALQSGGLKSGHVYAGKRKDLELRRKHF